MDKLYWILAVFLSLILAIPVFILKASSMLLEIIAFKLVLTIAKLFDKGGDAKTALAWANIANRNRALAQEPDAERVGDDD